MRAAAGSERKRAGRRRAHQLAGAGALAARASRERLTRGTAPASQRGHLRASALTRLRVLDLRARSRLAPRPRTSPRTAAVARFPFSLPLPGARRSRAPVLSVLLPGATRAASEDGGRIRPHVLASDATHVGVPGLQLRKLAPGALAERSEALGRRLRLRKPSVSEAKAARGPPRREATRETKSPGSDHRGGIGQRPATKGSGMRRA